MNDITEAINMEAFIIKNNVSISKGYFENWEEQRLVLTNEERIIFQYTFLVAVCGLVSSFGIASNIINAIIFYKQGFSNTVNIAFLGLAISDCWALIFLLWTSLCLSPLLPIFGVPWVPEDVVYVTAAWPHIWFCRTTSYITVYITGERCLSIAFPLKVKQIVTKSRTTTIICLIYLVNLMTIVPELATTYLGWRFVPEKNRTLLTINFTSSRKSVEGISFVIHSLVSMVSFFGVVFFTAVLAVKLKQSSKIRNEITLGQDEKGSMSVRDKRAVKMIVLIASILIACYIPGATIALTVFIVGPDFNIHGKYLNICASVCGIACSFQSINSSVNIFLYYKMSSKYKKTFDSIFLYNKFNSKYRKTVVKVFPEISSHK